MDKPLAGKVIVITDAARRVGKIFALACAGAGADVVIHHAHSDEESKAARVEIEGLGQRAWVFKVDLSDFSQAKP